MAWDRRRRRGSQTGVIAFVANNLSLALFTVLALGLLVVARADDSLFENARATISDASVPLLEALSAPAEMFKHGADDFSSFFTAFDTNKKLRAENAKLSAMQREVEDLRRKVQLYEQLLKAPSEEAVSAVTARVIADASGPFAHTVLLNAGHEQGIAKGHAVADERGLLGRVVTSGQRSARVLLLTDLNSRVPVMIEGANLKAILAGDNSGRPVLEYLPPGSVLHAGARVVTTPDGGVFPPGVPVGVIAKGSNPPRVQLYTVEGRADFVRILRYTAPVDVNDAAPEPLPGAIDPNKPKPPATPKPAAGPVAPATPPAPQPGTPTTMRITSAHQPT